MRLPPRTPTRSTIPFCALQIALALLATACSTSEIQSTPEAPVSRAAVPLEKRILVAVMPFEYRAEQEAYRTLADKLPDLMIEELFQTGRYRLIERTRIEEVLKEVELGQSGLIDEKTAVKAGKQLGAQALLLGTVTGIKRLEARDGAGSSVYIKRMGFEVSLRARVISLNNGEIIAAANAVAAEVTQEKRFFGAKTGEIVSDEAMINTALRKATRLLALRLHEP